MDREYFLKELFLMYPNCFNEYNVAIWKRKYEIMLPQKIDFDGLEVKFARTWNDMRTPPSPSELRELAKDYLTTTYQPSYSSSTSCPPSPEWNNLVEKLGKKLSMERML